MVSATAFPIAIYGCESWTMTSGDKKRVDAFERWWYRILLRVSWKERKTNKWVLEKIWSVLTLRKSMAERKMRLFGHIVRTNGMKNRLMQGKMEGKRRRGRPATTWFQDLKEWTKLDIVAASQNIKSDSKSFYAYVRSKQNVRDKVGPLVDNAGNITTQGFLMAEELNMHFSSVSGEKILVRYLYQKHSSRDQREKGWGS